MWTSKLSGCLARRPDPGPSLHEPRTPRYRGGVAKYQDLIADEDGLLATTGRAWSFGDHVPSQDILGAEHLGAAAEVARGFVFAAVDPGFAAAAAAGDFVVAGLDFAADATHRAVPAALKALGIAAV